MSNIHTFLPRLTVNQLFMRDLVHADTPCFALGYVENRGEKSGFIAMRPEKTIPQHVTQKGMNFGHGVLGTDNYKIFQFAFEFYGHCTYHGLVPASNAIINTVLSTMIETQDYYFFAINPDNSVTAFRSQIETQTLSALRENHEAFGHEYCSSEQYEAAVKAFSAKLDPSEKIMEWVCRDNDEYLDIEKYPFELTPRA